MTSHYRLLFCWVWREKNWGQFFASLFLWFFFACIFLISDFLVQYFPHHSINRTCWIETLVTPWQKPWQIRCENRLLAGGPKKVGGWVARLLPSCIHSLSEKNYTYLKCRKDLVIQRRVKKERQKEIWNYLQKKEISVEICIKKNNSFLNVLFQ